MADKKNIIDRINYVSGYVVSETPKYRPIIDSSSFDSIPEGINMTEADPAPATPPAAPEPSAAPNSGSTEPVAGSPEALATPAASTPPAPVAPEPLPTPAAPPLPDAQSAAPMPTAPSMPSENQNPASTDQLQADVLRFQLDAMKKMTQKIDELEGIIGNLNVQQAELYKEVDNVRDPSDLEKFANRKQDSSPYYFNLNDMWNGNTFQKRMDNFNSKGIVKTKDGYMADFDQLPKMNAYELKDSFEQI